MYMKLMADTIVLRLCEVTRELDFFLMLYPPVFETLLQAHKQVPFNGDDEKCEKCSRAKTCDKGRGHGAPDDGITRNTERHGRQAQGGGEGCEQDRAQPYAYAVDDGFVA